MERTIWKTENWVEGATGMSKKESYKEILVCLLGEFLKTGNNKEVKEYLASQRALKLFSSAIPTLMGRCKVCWADCLE